MEDSSCISLSLTFFHAEMKNSWKYYKSIFPGVGWGLYKSHHMSSLVLSGTYSCGYLSLMWNYLGVHAHLKLCMCMHKACLRVFSQYQSCILYIQSLRSRRKRKGLKDFSSWKQPGSWLFSFYEVDLVGCKIMTELEVSRGTNMTCIFIYVRSGCCHLFYRYTF